MPADARRRPPTPAAYLLASVAGEPNPKGWRGHRRRNLAGGRVRGTVWRCGGNQVTVQRLARCVLIVALGAGVLAVGPGATGAGATSSASTAEPDGGGATTADEAAIPDDAREAPADPSDRTDTDGDGVTDAEETEGTRNPWPSGLIGMAAPGDPTDPADPDSDDDGLSDGLEIGTDDGNRAGTGTDPNRADTDDDGVSDTAEVVAGTDPRAADTDHDRIDDGVEAGLGTDPDVSDSDFDGRSDGAERAAGTDPRVSAVTGAEVGGPFHFTDVPDDAYYYDAAYWATSDEVNVTKRTETFNPAVTVPRFKLAQLLRRYAGYLGRPTTTSPNPFTDVGALPRRARAAVAWADANGVLRGTSADRFSPDRIVTRSELALALFRFSVWAGHATTPSPADNTYTDTQTLPGAVRGAIGWLQAQGIIQATGAVTSTTRFKPTKEVDRAQIVAFLFRLDEVIGTPQPTDDDDGDGVGNLDEIQGFRNPYPEPTDGGDVDPLDPDGQCLSPAVAGELPPTADGPGAPTDPNNPDSDDDGMSDGREMDELRTDANDADTDNDCVSDGDEIDGFPLVLDLDAMGCPGGGSGGGCPNLTRRTAHSDPLDEDTDDDELADHEELLLRTDPELADSDLDGLDDNQEWNRWYTSPTSVDSDADSRGGDGNQPPTESLFDGIELRDLGTSPTRNDTDGDGATDGDELDSSIRNMTVAELPGFEMDLAGGTSILLRKERSADEGGAIEVGLSDSVETSTSQASTSSITQRETSSFSVEVGIEFGYASLSPQVLGHINVGYGQEWGTDTTREMSTEESTTLAREHSRTESEEWTKSEATVSGEISQGMVFRNTGIFTYELSQVGYTLYLRNPDTQTYEVVGTMTVPLDGIVLAPGTSTAPVQAVAQDVNPDLIEQFLGSPSSLQFATGNLEFLDSEGRNFQFVQESTFAQTAQVAVDFGLPNLSAEPRLETYSVSTNVDRDEIGGEFNSLSAYPGVRMGSKADDDPAYLAGVMDQIGYPRCPAGPAEGCYTLNGDGDLESVDGLANVSDGPPECRAARWVVSTQTEEQAETVDFDDIMVHAGDVIRLVRQTDCDGDSLPDNLESTNGACVSKDGVPVSDCDDDGLSDLEEIKGWIVGYPSLSGGASCADVGNDKTPWLNDSAGCPWVQSNPRLADSDDDGVTDFEERNGVGRDYQGQPLDQRTDPRSGDTDADTRSDCLASRDERFCRGAPPDSAPLHTSVRRVDNTPCATAGCWASPAPTSDLAAGLNIGGVNNDSDPRNDVRSIWVAGGTYLAPTGGFRLPGGVGIYGGFSGDEVWAYDRNPDPSAASSTRLVGSVDTDGAPVVVLASKDVIFDGFRVRGGEAGGIGGSSSEVRLANLLVSGNHLPPAVGAQSVGAGGITWIGNPNAPAHDVHLDHVTISSNTGPVGGLHLENVDDAVITDSVIRNNISDELLRPGNCDTTPAPRCSGGGGVSLIDGVATFDRSIIANNTALVGGGIDVSGPDSELRVISSAVTGNQARGNSVVVGRGGGIHAREADVLLSNCLVGDNRTVVGPRWPTNPEADGFGGGLFAYDDADVRILSCTVAGNQGGGALIAGDEGYSRSTEGPPVEGADATFHNTVVYGNDMDWQPTYLSREFTYNTYCNGDCDIYMLRQVARGLLGESFQYSDNQSVGGVCLGTPLSGYGGVCSMVWFRGLSASSSTEVRTGHVLPDAARVTTFDTMVGRGSRDGTYNGEYCGNTPYSGRSEDPYLAGRDPISCDGVTYPNRWVGFRGRGFIGLRRNPVEAPAADAAIGDFYQLPGYRPQSGTAAIDQGDQDIDWDPFTLDVIEDPPELDLAGNPRVVGGRIDLGAYERQPG